MARTVLWTIAIAIYCNSKVVAEVTYPYRIEGIDLSGRQLNSLAINDAGVLAYSVFPEQLTAQVTLPGEAFIVSGSGTTSLGSLGGSYVVSASINNSGKVVGSAKLQNGITNPVVYSQGTLNDLQLGAPSGGVATAINDSGEIVGSLSFANSSEAFYRSATGQLVILANLGGDASMAYDINEHGAIVGESRNTQGVPEGFIVDQSGIRSLGGRIALRLQ